MKLSEATRIAPGGPPPADSPDPDAGESWTLAATERVRQLLIAQDRVEHQTVAQLIDWLRAIDARPDTPEWKRVSQCRTLAANLELQARLIAAYLLEKGEIRP